MIKTTKKKKYYYDCPIQALYMMREFGVKISQAHGSNHADKYYQIDETELCNFATGAIEDFRGIEQIYVTPESEHIFEPKEGDIGICDKLLIPVKFDIKDWVPSKMLKKETYYEIKETLFVKTVYRDGKHFFNPKEEN